VAREGVVQAEGPPHLREARVDVEEHAARDGVEDRGIVAVAHHIHEARGRLRPLHHLGPRHAKHRRTPIDVEREGIGEAEAGEQIEQPAPLDRIVEGRRRSAGVGAHARVEPVDKDDVVAEPAEAEQELQVEPREAALPNGLGDGAAIEDRTGHGVTEAPTSGMVRGGGCGGGGP